MADVTLRAARPEDKPAVLAFCQRASEEGDYLAFVWDTWLADPSGTLLVGEQAGQPVAVARLRMVAEGEGWLEGLRVDPEHQRHGIGRLMVGGVMDAARARGAWVVRLFTSAGNLPAQGLFGQTGFEQVALFIMYEAEAAEGAAAEAVAAGGTLRAARPDERDALWGFLRASNLVPLNGGLLVEGWTARSLTPQLLQERLEAGGVRVLEEWGMIQGLAVFSRRLAARLGPRLGVQYIDGMAEGIGRLALALREEAARAALTRITLPIPDLLILHDAMAGAGYTRGEHGGQGLWCYARRLRTAGA